MLEPSGKESQDEKHRVLLSLLSNKHFAPARKFAALVGLADDQITVKEVRKTDRFFKTKSSHLSICVFFFFVIEKKDLFRLHSLRDFDYSNVNGRSSTKGITPT